MGYLEFVLDISIEIFWKFVKRSVVSVEYKYINFNSF